MANLTVGADGNTFIYAENRHDIAALTAASAGLTKKVKTAEDDTYTYSTVTEPDGDYQYRLRYMTILGTQAKDIIFFDSLENYVIVDENNDTSDWHGLLKSINLSHVIAMGCQPVVYLSSVANLDVSTSTDLEDSSV